MKLTAQLSAGQHPALCVTLYGGATWRVEHEGEQSQEEPHLRCQERTSLGIRAHTFCPAGARSCAGTPPAQALV